jgi:Pvc16 N-terminal domain
MSNYLAVATATETIAQIIREAVGPVIAGAEVTTDRPDRASREAAARVNVYLYQVAPNAALRNADLPMRGADGVLTNQPRTALDLYYLINFFGRDEHLIAQQLLGLTASALHIHGVLTRQDIVRAIQAAPGGFLNASTLPQQTELLKITPNAVALEELSKLWSMMFQVPYTLSMSYLCSVVILDGPPVGAALPVRALAPSTGPGLAPVVTRVESATAGTPIVIGSTIAIRGRGMAGPGTTVAVGDVVLTPAAPDVSDTLVTVALTDSRLSAGPLSLVVNAASGSSPPAGFVLSPTITAARARRADREGDATLRLTLDPPVWSTWPVTVLLNAIPPSGGPVPRQYAFDAPAPAAGAPPRRLSHVVVPIPGVERGTYLVRVQVNGAESPLATATQRDGTTPYVSPRVRVP